MAGATVGYVRVSSVDQKTDRQLEGVAVDQRFEDKASGKDVRRPGLEECLRFLRKGDTLVCHSIDRLARSLADLERVVQELNDRGVTIKFVKESLTFGAGDESPMARLQLQMMGAFAQFERSLIRERQREGIASAKAKGKHLGRSAALTADQVQEIHRRVAAGEHKTALAKEFGVSAPTLYASLKRHPAA